MGKPLFRGFLSVELFKLGMSLAETLEALKAMSVITVRLSARSIRLLNQSSFPKGQMWISPLALTE